LIEMTDYVWHRMVRKAGRRKGWKGNRKGHAKAARKGWKRRRHGGVRAVRRRGRITYIGFR
jgi:hypothetical protein